MDRYICLDCGSVLTADELVTKYERHPYGDGVASESFQVCRCGSDAWTEAALCENCGVWFEDVENDEGLCPACRKDAVRKLTLFMVEHLTPAQRAWMQENYLAG